MRIGQAETGSRVAARTMRSGTKYADLNCAVTREEVSSIHRAAMGAGPWGFNDPPQHDGFAI